MKKSNWLGIALSVLVVVVFLVWGSADAQKPQVQGDPVVVQNSAAMPVPITAPAPIPVTGSLAVSNTAVPVTAAATFPVSGTVNLGGTASVQVVNDSSNPVIVQNAAASGKTPFYIADWVVIPRDGGEVEGTYTVPANKVVVIEYVNFFLGYGTGGAADEPIPEVWVDIVQISPRQEYQFVPSYSTCWVPTNQSWTHYRALSEKVSMRFTAEVKFSAIFRGWESAAGRMGMSLSGYLEDAQ
jgi:hypothetical protein